MVAGDLWEFKPGRMKLGLFGFPLGHSFSQGIFKKIFEINGIEAGSYQLFPIEDPSTIMAEALNNQLQGFNVTIPHKTQIIPFLDELDDAARSLNAVNTVKIRNGKAKGFNTDHIGFSRSLSGIEFQSRKALILGSGGSSKAVAYALKEMDWEFKIVSRMGTEGNFNYSELPEVELDDISLVVNCTPLGMHPEIKTYPEIPFQRLSPDTLLYDLVYNPEITTFLKKGEEFGLRTKNGLEMLILQAQESWEIWKA